MTLAVIAFYIAFSVFFESEAQAKIYRGEKPVSDDVVNAMKGQLTDIIDARNKNLGKPDGKVPTHLYKLLASIDELHQSKSKHDMLDTSQKVNGNLEILWDGLVELVKGEGYAKDLPKEERAELLERWIDIGSRTKAWYREIITKWEGGMHQTLDYGKTLAKIGAEVATDELAPAEISKTYMKVRTQGN